MRIQIGCMKCGWCLGQAKAKVLPSPGFYDTFDLVEARPHRFIRVVHANLAPPAGRQPVISQQPAADGSAAIEMLSYCTRRQSNYSAPSLKRGSASLNPADWILFFVHGVASSAQDWSAQVLFEMDVKIAARIGSEKCLD